MEKPTKMTKNSKEYVNKAVNENPVECTVECTVDDVFVQALRCICGGRLDVARELLAKK